MALSRVQICNMALSELPTSRIDSLDDGSLEAETCEAHYRPALELLIEDHDYDFAVKRATLATVANERTDEWVYAYALPTDMARPRYLLPAPETAIDAGSAVYQLTGRLRSYEGVLSYQVAGGRLYSSWSPAVLEYVSNDPSEALFTAKFARALALELASRIVMPLLKSRERQGELIRMAEAARERAKAEDMNRDPERTWDFVPEVFAARAGWPMNGRPYPGRY